MATWNDLPFEVVRRIFIALLSPAKARLHEFSQRNSSYQHLLRLRLVNQIFRSEIESMLLGEMRFEIFHDHHDDDQLEASLPNGHIQQFVSLPTRRFTRKLSIECEIVTHYGRPNRSWADPPSLSERASALLQILEGLSGGVLQHFKLSHYAESMESQNSARETIDKHPVYSTFSMTSLDFLSLSSLELDALFLPLYPHIRKASPALLEFTISAGSSEEGSSLDPLAWEPIPLIQDVEPFTGKLLVRDLRYEVATEEEVLLNLFEHGVTPSSVVFTGFLPSFFVGFGLLEFFPDFLDKCETITFLNTECSVEEKEAIDGGMLLAKPGVQIEWVGHVNIANN